MDKNPYVMRSVTTFYRNEIKKLKKLLSDHRINYDPVLRAHRAGRHDYYVTVYRKPDRQYVTKVTMYAPSRHDGRERLKTGDSNLYGWVVVVVMYCRLTY